MFDYPNDQALSDSAKLLSSELKKLASEHPKQKVILLTYSMGGLVARETIENSELAPDNVVRLIMIATPNHGSMLAKYAYAADLWEHALKKENQRIMNRLHASILDGLAESVNDLKPDSTFLTKLNKRKRNSKIKYTLILGTGGPFTKNEIETISKRLSSLPDRRPIFQRVGKYLSKQILAMDELVTGKGDGVVAVSRGKLAGVEDTLLLPFGHLEVNTAASKPAIKKLHAEIRKRLTD